MTGIKTAVRIASVLEFIPSDIVKLRMDSRWVRGFEIEDGALIVPEGF